jgi:hypothetical protein
LALAGVAALGTPVACEGGTETGNPGKDDSLVAFDASACKKDAEVPSGQSQEALVTASEYDGLRCVEWEKQSDGKLTVRLLNVHGGCSIPWKGEAGVRDDGTVELRLVNPACAVALCGWCIYDFSFTLKGAPAPAGLPLEVGQVACPGDAPEWDPVIVLPDDAADSGILCRYANQFAYDQLLGEQDRCGSKFGTCGDQGGFCAPAGGTTTCRDDLVCALADDASRCLEPCHSDDDCTPRAVSACVDGVCRLSATY